MEMVAFRLSLPFLQSQLPFPFTFNLEVTLRVSIDKSPITSIVCVLTTPTAGLAMFVYMDGEYQCNRNRYNLKLPDVATPSTKSEVNFRVRQKEELQEDGTFIGSQWKFRELNIGKRTH